MSKDKKIIARHVQYFAAEKAINRIKEYVEGISQKNKGLIWHWQGSGKTYTMIYIAYRFFQEYFRNDPIIFFMVDRIELQRQLYEEFIKNLEIKNFKEHIKLVSSIEELKNILKEIADNEKNKKVVKRGIYIVTIQKFRPEDLKDLEIRKKEILLLIDEAHRSQYGILAATMNKVLPNAIKIAFTGTPVFKKFERNTFSWFEYPEEKELYLHKYFINDSIGDGFTVPIIYKVVTEKDISINVREEDIKELINMWLKNVNEVGSLDDYIDEENITVTKNEIKEKLDNIKVFLENPRRLEKLAEYIAETIKENTEGFKFKAMVVTASRLACVRLWNYLVHELEKRYGSDAKKWVEVVMTYTNNDPKEIMEFKQDLLKRWKGYGNTDEINVEIQDRFKREENPKILIVTDMLITGFDCPKLKVMYLDKPLYDHKLLQTIARVNRPYKDNETEKEYGLIIDSVGLLEHAKNTVLTYENIGDKEISDDIRKMMRKGDDIFSEFENTLSKLKKVLKEGIEVNSLKISIDIDQLKEKTHYKNFIKYLQEDINPKLEILSFNIYKPEVYEKILEPMKRVISLYDNLGADPRKVNYRNEYEIIAYMYNFIRLKAYGDMPKSLSEGLWKNVLNEIYDKTSVKGFGEKTEIKIVGEKLERLGENPREYFKSLEGQRIAAEAFFSIRDLIKQDLANPAYKHIAERLKELQEKWNSRGDPSLLKEIMSIYEETMSYREKTKGLSPQEKIITDIKQTIYQKYKKEVKLSSFSEALKSGDVQKVEDFDKLKNELWTSLFKDLAKELKDVPRGEKKKLVDELIDYVVKVLRDAKKNA